MNRQLPTRYINENTVNYVVSNVITEMKQQKINEGEIWNQIKDWGKAIGSTVVIRPLLVDLAKKIGLREDGLLFKWLINNKLIFTIISKRLITYVRKSQQMNEGMFNWNGTTGAFAGGLAGLTSATLLRYVLEALGFDRSSIFMKILNMPILTGGLGALIGNILGRGKSMSDIPGVVKDGFNNFMNVNKQQNQLPFGSQTQQLRAGTNFDVNDDNIEDVDYEEL